MHRFPQIGRDNGEANGIPSDSKTTKGSSTLEAITSIRQRTTRTADRMQGDMRTDTFRTGQNTALIPSTPAPLPIGIRTSKESPTIPAGARLHTCVRRKSTQDLNPRREGPRSDEYLSAVFAIRLVCFFCYHDKFWACVKYPICI